MSENRSFAAGLMLLRLLALLAVLLVWPENRVWAFTVAPQIASGQTAHATPLAAWEIIPPADRTASGYPVAAEEAAPLADEAFHYTFSRYASSIETNGLRAGSYATDTGGLSPLQAQIDLALPANRGLPDALLRIDLNGLRGAGYDVPGFTQAGRMFNMPGGGAELQFPYAIPPEFISVVR